MGVTLIALDTGSIVRLIGVAEQLIATTLLFPVVPYMLDKYVHADVRFG
jgi:rod shape-determining protein MreD